MHASNAHIVTYPLRSRKKHLTKKTFIYADVSVFCRPEKLYFELNVYFYVMFRQEH